MEINDLLKNPESIKQLISVLQSLLPNEEKTIKNPKNNIKTKKSTAKSKNSKENKFLSMAEKNMHKEDVEIDKLLSKRPPSARSRSFSYVDAICRTCGKKEKVNPTLVHEMSRYKCNTCSTSAN